MTHESPSPNQPGRTIFSSTESILLEFTDTDLMHNMGAPMWTPASLLASMRERIKYYGAPLPDGFIAPPGIDLDALLKQVPWPPDDQPTA